MAVVILRVHTAVRHRLHARHAVFHDPRQSSDCRTLYLPSRLFCHQCWPLGVVVQVTLSVIAEIDIAFREGGSRRTAHVLVIDVCRFAGIIVRTLGERIARRMHTDRDQHIAVQLLERLRLFGCFGTIDAAETGELHQHDPPIAVRFHRHLYQPILLPNHLATRQSQQPKANSQQPYVPFTFHLTM